MYYVPDGTEQCGYYECKGPKGPGDLCSGRTGVATEMWEQISGFKDWAGNCLPLLWHRT